MSFYVFHGHMSLVSLHHLFLQWVSDSEDIITVYSVDDVPPRPDGGLFSSPPSIIVEVEKISASNIRQLFYRSEDTGESIVIVAQQRPRGKFDKDGIEIHEVEYPAHVSQRERFIKGYVPEISARHCHTIAQRYDDGKSALIAARQCSFLPENSSDIDKVFVPSPKDAPPWDITGAINVGDTHAAVTATKRLLSMTKTTPHSLAMQLLGYYISVATRKTPYFHTIHAHMVTPELLVPILSEYPSRIFRSGKTPYCIIAMVASLSLIFSRSAQ